MKLYELTEIYQEIINMDIEEEDLQTVLKNINDELETKAENIAKIIQTLKSDIAGYKAEEERLYKHRKTAENKLSSLKQYLEQTMIETNHKKFKSGNFSFNIQKNPPSLKIDDPTKIPEEYQIIEIKPNRKSLLEALKDGEEIDGVEIIQTESLRIR